MTARFGILIVLYIEMDERRYVYVEFAYGTVAASWEHFFILTGGDCFFSPNYFNVRIVLCVLNVRYRNVVKHQNND